MRVLSLEELKENDGRKPVYLKGNAYSSLAYLGSGTIGHEEDCFVAYYFGIENTDFLDCKDYMKIWFPYDSID